MRTWTVEEAGAYLPRRRDLLDTLVPAFVAGIFATWPSAAPSGGSAIAGPAIAGPAIAGPAIGGPAIGGLT